MGDFKSKPNVRLVDVAQEVGVSIVTVAKVLNNTGGRNARVSPKTAEKIIRVAAQMEYCPNMVARQLAGKKSGIIGVVLDSCAPRIHQQRLSLMEMAAAEQGYRFMIGQAHENIERIGAYANIFASYGVDGVICMAHNYPGVSRKIAELYLSQGKTVFFNKPAGPENCCSVGIDVAAAFVELVSYLKQKGRTRIGLFLAQGYFENPSMSIRESGYLQGLNLNGVNEDPRLIKRIPIQDIMDEEKIFNVVRDLVLQQKVDAIAAGNDHIAAMILKNLRTLGVAVPDDVAVTGFDNIDVARLVCPSLTTCDQNNELAAGKLVNMLVNLIAEKAIPVKKRNLMIKPVLIRRESA